VFVPAIKNGENDKNDDLFELNNSEILNIERYNKPALLSH